MTTGSVDHAVSGLPRSAETWIASAAVLAAVPVFLIIAGWAVLPAAFCLVALAAMVLLVNPRWAFVLFIPSIGWFHPLTSGLLQLQLSDLLVLIMMLGVVYEWLWRARSQVHATPLDAPFLALFLATYWSIPFAYDYSMTVTPALRIIYIYVTFRLVFKLAREMGLSRVVRYYVLVVGAFSAFNVFQFISIGGSVRVFGVSWLTFESLAMTAFPMGVAFMIHASGNLRRVGWGLIVLVIGTAVLTSGSRGTMLGIALGLPILVWAIGRSRGGIGTSTLLKIVLPLGALVVATYLLRDTLLEYPVERIEALIGSVGDPQGSVALRIVLWTAAVKAFLAHPLTGIGIGNYRVLDMALPTQHMVPVWYYIRGMSAHNTLLHYLAETGLPGGLALIFLLWRTGRTAVIQLRKAAATGTGLAVFMGAAVFVVSVFFMRAWTWGQDSYVMAFVLGTLAAWWHQNR